MVGRVCIPLKTWTSVYDTKLIHFHSHILFLYHLKTSKNLRFSVFMEHRSGIFDWKLVKRAKLFSEKITWPNSHYSTKKYWNLKNGRFILFIYDKTNTPLIPWLLLYSQESSKVKSLRNTCTLRKFHYKHTLKHKH